MPTADSLAHRLDALSEALRAAGVDADRIAQVLGSAATATMNALLLDAVVEDNLLDRPTNAPQPEPAAVEIVEQPLRAAA